MGPNGKGSSPNTRGDTSREGAAICRSVDPGPEPGNMRGIADPSDLQVVSRDLLADVSVDRGGAVPGVEVS